MKNNSEEVEVIELGSNELPLSHKIEYLTKKFLYKVNGKKKKNGIKFVVYDDKNTDEIPKEFILIWNDQLETTNLNKYLFDKEGNKIKNGIETFLLDQKNNEVSVKKIVLIWESMLKSEFSYMYDRYGNKRWGTTKFGTVSQNGKFIQFPTLILDPEDEQPLWMDDPEEIQKKFNVWTSVLENAEDIKGEIKGIDKGLATGIIQLTVFMAFFMILAKIGSTTNDNNTINDNIKTVSTKTVRISGNKNQKYKSKEEIKNQIIKVLKTDSNMRESHKKIKKEKNKNTGEKLIQEKHKETLSYPILI